MIPHYEVLEEVNLLFEKIKTMLITGLSEIEVSLFLERYTHYEIRRGKRKGDTFYITDCIPKK